MDDLTMEAIESLAEKMTAKDTPEDNVTPVQVSSSTDLISMKFQEVLIMNFKPWLALSV